jgi:hypothetical protein
MAVTNLVTARVCGPQCERTTQDVVRDLEIGQPINSEQRSETADGGSWLLPSAQLVALEKAKTEKEAHGEFESEHPGYFGAQIL